MRIPAFAIVAVALTLGGAAPAEGAAQGAPRFTLAEEVVIARNDALTELLEIDPWSVRKILDAMAAAKQKPPGPARERQRDVGPGRSDTVRIDPGRNPDLEIFQRASPEAAYDLFQILKRVGGTQSGAK